MTIKRVLCPQRLRQIPRQFSWLDQRLVTDRYIDRCSVQSLALYLFLLSVADAKGLSYYSDSSVIARLSLSTRALHEAREQLIQVQLIAYHAPIYQVLALERNPSEQPEPVPVPRQTHQRPISFAELLHKMEVRHD
jgi:hypothetical protein